MNHIGLNQFKCDCFHCHGVEHRLMPGWEIVTCELTVYGDQANKVWVTARLVRLSIW